MSTQIVKGSLAALARENHTSIAETFINADVVIMVDTSSSMEAVDEGMDGQTRYRRACNELAKLQNSLPGRIAVISWSSSPVFCPNGVPTLLGGGTELADALKFVRVADGCDMRFIVISDGDVWEPERTLKEARKFKSRIDTIFIGPEDGSGQEFLQKLAAASGGGFSTNHAAQDLGSSLQRLLTAA